ncbi:hypothetical protein K439DRAFT_550894 [Ramaria rubella]|nr:hypothetical protein K439DRAFT_550894 [Ramaria rubella]
MHKILGPYRGSLYPLLLFVAVLRLWPFVVPLKMELGSLMKQRKGHVTRIQTSSLECVPRVKFGAPLNPEIALPPNNLLGSHFRACCMVLVVEMHNLG